MRKKILVVADTIDLNHSSGGKANYALVQSLVKSGFSVCVFHYSHQEVLIPNVAIQLIHEKRFTWKFFCSRLVNKIRKYTSWKLNDTVEKLFGFSFTFFNDVKSIHQAIKKVDINQYDWVFTLSYASSFRSHAAVLKLPHWHAKWLAYVHDPYPMHSYPRPYDWVEPGHTFKRNFFLQIAQHAKYMSYPSQYLAEWMESYYPIAKGKTVIIPHQMAEVNEKPYDVNVFGTKQEFRILHAGNLMSARNPMALVQAFQLFLQQHPEACEHSKLIFVGMLGVFQDPIHQVQKECQNIIVSDGYMPFEQTIALQKEVSINVILEAKGPYSPFLPGKITHAVMANKPILALGPYYSEVRRLLGHDYPYWAEIDQVQLIANHLSAIYQKWQHEGKVALHRPDLTDYLSEKYLEKTIQALAL